MEWWTILTSPDLIKKRWKSPDGCLCYCSEGKPWYLRELFLRHFGPRVMGKTLIFWPENLDRLCVYAGAGEIFPTKGGRRGTGSSWARREGDWRTLTTAPVLEWSWCGREELDMERYHHQSLIKRNPASNYHYTVIGTSSQHTANYRVLGPASPRGGPHQDFISDGISASSNSLMMDGPW